MIHIETAENMVIGGQEPVRIVCSCGAFRALSPSKVLLADWPKTATVWMEQAEAFRDRHKRCPL